MKKILVLFSLLMLCSCKIDLPEQKRVSSNSFVNTNGYRFSVAEYNHNGNNYLVFRCSDGGIFVIKESK